MPVIIAIAEPEETPQWQSAKFVIQHTASFHN